MTLCCSTDSRLFQARDHEARRKPASMKVKISGIPVEIIFWVGRRRRVGFIWKPHVMPMMIGQTAEAPDTVPAAAPRSDRNENSPNPLNSVVGYGADRS